MPGTGAQGRADLVPRPRRHRPLHQQDRALPRRSAGAAPWGGSFFIRTATDRALELVNIAAEAASDKLAEEIVAYDVSDQLVITDAFVLCSAPSDRQVRSIVDEVEDRLRDGAGIKPVRREGERDGRWVLLDYAEIVVHIQHEEERGYYGLERLWKDCPTIELPENARGAERTPLDEQ